MTRITPVIFLIALFNVSTVLAQINMDSAGRVSVGPGSHPEIQLRVENNANTTSNYGVYGLSSAGTNRRGTFGFASGGTSTAGLYGYAENATGSNYGIVAYAGGNDSWAGWFVGKIGHTGGVYNVSDRNLKENIRSLDGENILDKLLALTPSRFTFRRDPNFARINFPDGEQVGFIAQEVEPIFPELVSTVNLLVPENPTAGSAGTTAGGFKTVNYTAMIPLLLQAIQDQQIQISKLESILQANGLR